MAEVIKRWFRVQVAWIGGPFENRMETGADVEADDAEAALAEFKTWPRFPRVEPLTEITVERLA